MECLALQPEQIKQWEYKHLHRYLLAGLFRLERDRVVVTGAGPSGQRYRMRLSWQGHTECVLGIYEPNVIAAVQRYVRPGDVCFDIGSHVGYLALLMAQLAGPQGQIVAFEPMPETFETLRENVLLNNLENVRLERIALSDQDGSITLYCDADQELSWTPSVAAYSAPDKQLRAIAVPAQSLDSYIASTALRPNLVKIDVEGAELAVLRGGLNALRVVRPVVLLEIHDLGPDHRSQVVEFLRECEYQVSQVDTRDREVFCLATPREAKTV